MVYLTILNIDSTSNIRQRQSCLFQLLAHFEDVLARLEANQNVYVIYLDFAKSFDKVDQNILAKKLKLSGINGILLRWIEFFLRNLTQKVMVDGFLSDAVHVKSGVPRGSVLGPLLFFIMILDIDCDILESVLFYLGRGKQHELQ